MDPDLPRPRDILEELAEKAAAQIERMAPVAFDKSFDELLNYHRFLLALNASETPDGSPYSFAEVSDSMWDAPHRRWLRHYVRLFERAADRLPEDDHFIHRLVYAPSRLLPHSNDPALPNKVVAAILGLGPILMHRLEAWITKRTMFDIQYKGSEIRRRSLSGSDAKSYENVLPEVVGAWEHLLLKLLHDYNHSITNKKNDKQLWSAYRATWPLVWQHLTDTAHCLSITVWNEDEIGARFFLEALVRWPQNLIHRFSDRAHLRHPRLLFPTLLELDWPDAVSYISSNTYNFPLSPSPKQLFSTMIRLAHNDVLLLTAALMLHWSITERNASDVGARTAKALLRREGGEEDHGSPKAQDPRFEALFLDFLRMVLAGEESPQGSYANEMDGLVEKLDSMTERPRVPGRVFTPTTVHGRYELTFGMVAMMLAVVPKEADGAPIDEIGKLALEEKILPDGDQSLRRLLKELDRWDSILQESPQSVVQGSYLLFAERSDQRDVARLAQIIASARAEIGAERSVRLAARPVDKVKLDIVREKIESALLNNPPDIAFFGNVEVRTTPKNEEVEWCKVPIGGIPKGLLTDPPMEQFPVNFYEALISTAQGGISNSILRSFRNRDRIGHALALPIDHEDFWQEIKNMIDRVGPDPVLLVSRASEDRALRRYVYSSTPRQENVSIETTPPNGRSNSFIATINGIQVFGSDLASGQSWLFSRNVLKSVRYAELDQRRRVVDIRYELGEEARGTLHVCVRQLLEWVDFPVFQIQMPDFE